jgi:hypothetical protein
LCVEAIRSTGLAWPSGATELLCLSLDPDPDLLADP